FLVLATDARQIESGLQPGNLREGDQAAIFREGSAGEAFQTLRGICSGAENYRNGVVAFAIDRDRGAAEISIEQPSDFLGRHAQLPRAILIDFDDDLDDLVAPVVIVVANVWSGLEQ